MDTLRFSRICDDGQDATESRHRQSALAADRQPNLSAFDWIRVAAAFGVVTLHACVPYLKNPMPGLNWAVTDASSTVVDVTFWSIEVFIMPVFLVIAGILSWYSLSRRGPMELFRSRTRRLGKPLLFGLVVILPMDLYTWLCGWVFEEHILPIKIKSLKIEGPLGEHLWGTGHLWFLGYLLSYVACLALAYHFWKHGFPFATKKSRIESGSKFPRIPARIVLGCLTAIGVCVLTVRPEVVWGFQHAFAPVPSKWIYSATFFVGGVWLARQTGSLDRLKCHSPRLAMPSLLVLAATLMLGRWHLADHEPGTSTANIVAPALAILTTVAAWS
ncbi:MAG: acyltransferase, partial [Planctomycetota bacterium]